jgi:serine protease Do
MLDVSILGAVQLAKRLAVAALACAIGLTTAHAQTQSQSDVDALVRAADAVVGVRVEAVEDAGSAATLGTLRQGSGVVIGDDGLVLTIGYLVL